jgi:hypothetical protein
MGWVVNVTPRPRFTAEERTTGIHWMGRWEGLRAGLDTEARGNILYLRWGSNPINPVLQSVVRHQLHQLRMKYLCCLHL